MQTVLRELENSGKLQRGYLVEGLGASQYALPEAVERLRHLRAQKDDDRPILLAALDPASPYGSLAPWPDADDPRRPSRSVGACVVQKSGELLSWLHPVEGRLILFRNSDDVLEAVIRLIAEAVAHGRVRPFMMSRLDGRPVNEHPLGHVFERCGYSLGSRGVAFRRVPMAR